MAEQVADQRARTDRPGFEEMARSIHASYLRRWNRHDPRSARSDERGPTRPDGRRETTAA